MYDIIEVDDKSKDEEKKSKDYTEFGNFSMKVDDELEKEAENAN